jgi:NAD(P)-dependent dehydrogenase (short-subunit alcohol dehydrogenase family)
MGETVLVVIGVGGMGLAVARRCGSGRKLLLADTNEGQLSTVADALADEGHAVTSLVVDVTDAASVERLAEVATGLGRVRALVHTAGVSPVQAPAELVLAVDLVGAALVLEAFAEMMSEGSAGVVISSMAGHLVPPLPADDVADLARVPATELGALACVEAAAVDPGLAYAFAKAAITVRVRAAAQAWGRRGARINVISPGVIATSMGRMELEGPSGDFMRLMVDSSGTGRLGTPDDIAAATEFLLSDGAAFITGTDLLVDGGVVAAVQSGQLGSPDPS